MVEQGLNTIISRRGVSELVDALIAAVQAAGLTVYARVDHAARAAEQGVKLRPTQLLLFGNPAAGFQLMEANQVVGIDLPFRALAWEDEDGEIFLTYPDPDWIAERHGLGSDCAQAIAAIKATMAKTVVKAAGL